MSNEYVYVAVDETGNLGKSLKGEHYYILVACVVNDRERFENATRDLDYKEEVKFYTHPELREKVLKEAIPAVSKVYYVQYHKKETLLDRYEQFNQHLKMVRALADKIVKDYGRSHKMTVEVDKRDGITSDKICDIFEDNENRINVIECAVLDSEKSYGLQTNDFFVGAVGYLINHSNNHYVKPFKKKLKRTYIHSKNVKKQGEPASTVRQRTGHADIPFETGKPPGIATGLMCLLRPSKELGSPMVRLIDPSELGYINACERSDDNVCSSKNAKKAERDLLPPYGRVQAHTDIPQRTGKPSEFPMRSESERKGRHQSFPMVSYRRQRTKKDKSLSRKQGEPASTHWQTTGHADIPFGTGKPPGIATGLMGSLRSNTRSDSPVVRLGNPSHTSYKNNSERRRIFGRMRK